MSNKTEWMVLRDGELWSDRFKNEDLCKIHIRDCVSNGDGTYANYDCREMTKKEIAKYDKNPIEPSHCVDMKISPLEFIEANQDLLTWCTSNVIKYVGRHQRKNGLEDLKKAQWYLNYEIERLEKDCPLLKQNI